LGLCAGFAGSTWAQDSATADSIRSGAEVLRRVNEINQNYQQAGEPVERSLGSVAWEMGLSLLLVVALLIAVAYLLKKLKVTQGGLQKNVPGMRTIGSFWIDSTHRITLVELGKKVLVLGITQDHIRTLAELEGEEAGQFLLEAGVEPVGAAQFSATVNSLLQNFKRKDKGGG
jgi:flagellar biosynthetic protein FliO